jgi:hypothetical protein
LTILSETGTTRREAHDTGKALSARRLSSSKLEFHSDVEPTDQDVHVVAAHDRNRGRDHHDDLGL